MTAKYESVLSEADKKEIREKYLRGFISQKPCNLIELTEQATLAKLQPQLDAIGAGGVSGQRVTGLSARPTDDELWDQTISDRDHNEEQANKLANAIANYFGAEIGEHTSANCPWRNALEVIENSDNRIADDLYQAVEKELLDIEMCFENFDTPQQAINALIEWHVSVPRIAEGYKLVPIDMLKDALTRVKDVLYKAYNNAQQECCGKGRGGECCGNPVIVWSEDDEEIMDKLSPVQKYIAEILSAAPTPDTE